MADLVIELCTQHHKDRKGWSIENPAGSRLFHLKRFRELLELSGVRIVRCDYCQFGTPYKRPTVFITNCQAFEAIALRCDHVAKHSVQLNGTATRKAAPYPPELVKQLVVSLGAYWQEHGTLASVVSEACEGTDVQHSAQPTLDEFAAAESNLEEPGDVVDLKGLSVFALECSRLADAQREDPEFSCIIALLDAEARLGAPFVGRVDQELRGRGYSKAEIKSARAQRESYELRDLLFRQVHDPLSISWVLCAVIPSGCRRSFWFNGRKYDLSLRKSFLLLCHESEVDGCHSNREETSAKLKRACWWSTMLEDVRDWTASCAVCRLVNAQPALTAELRSQLYDRPFRIIYVDTVGPLPETIRGNRYIHHAMCPYSEFA